VTAIAGHSPFAALWRLLRDPAAWVAAVDVFAILTAIALPFSTSLTAIFVVAMLIASVPSLDRRAVQSLRSPIAAMPIAFFALALAGTFWSDAAWGERLYAVFPAAKLLVLPVLFHHFERSGRGAWVFVAFLGSCTLLMVLSWMVTFAPGLTLKPAAEASRGIFVKNYIDQSQEFALCAVALAYPAVQLLRQRKIWQALALCALGLSLVANMAFVIVSRTALVTMPIMLAVFGLLHLRLRTNLLILGAAGLIALAAWLASPQLEWTLTTFSRDYRLYKDEHVPTSVGERLEYWKGALAFFVEAPLMGHGTGSTRGLFEQAAQQPGWVAGVRALGNPHNQTLNVAVQWGAVGVVVLYAMWLVHLLLFRGEGLANWIGLLVVVQNVFTSLFNSHIFDFHEGWMYVLGVGVAGGMVLRAKTRANQGS
jgi:O-antigen ligase